MHSSVQDEYIRNYFYHSVNIDVPEDVSKLHTLTYSYTHSSILLLYFCTAFEDPNMDLFEWSILQNRKELAFVFLQECRVCLSKNYFTTLV